MINYVPQQGKELSNEQIKKLIEENHVKFVRLQFVDINGMVKNLAVPAKQIDKILNNELMLDGSSIKGFRSIETSDMYFYPDRSTFAILPWREKEGKWNVARIICDIHNADGTPFEGCPRCNLKRVIKEAEEMGFVMNVGPEAEFFLFKKDENGIPSTYTHDAAGYYDVGPDDKGEDIRAHIVDALEQLGFEIEASHHEAARGQHEVDFKYADALTAADNIVTFKYAVKASADKFGLHATFMPKPIFGINGSGMHCNISLFNKKEGKNAFYCEDSAYQLSKEALYTIGGIIEHVKDFTAITNPTVNSYKRLVPGFEAPVYIAWSLSNRSALIRVPAKRGNATRVELRSPDASCNPYLVMAVLLTVAMDGVKNQIKPPLQTEENIYDMTAKERKRSHIESLPGSLNEALALMKKSKIVKKALGEHIFNEFVTAKEMEWDRYRTAVTPWEIDEYLEKY